jgi:LPS O-antigen subunit length determinant protein (WzzB/FepE family)
MTKKKFYIQDLIYFNLFLKKMWKEKTLIIITSILFVFVTLLYISNQKNEFKTKVVINNPSLNDVGKYIFFHDSNPDLNYKFIENFFLKLNSKDNLNDYIKINESRYGLSNFFTKFDPKKNYFKNDKFYKLLSNKRNYGLKNTDQIDIYFLIYPEGVDGEQLLNNYIFFTQKKIIDEYKIALKSRILDSLSNYQDALKVAQQLNFKLPINENNNNLKNILFIKGTHELEYQINTLNKLLKSLDTDKDLFYYDILHEKASLSTKHSRYKVLSLLISLFLGFIFSLIIIFLKSKIRVKF